MNNKSCKYDWVIFLSEDWDGFFRRYLIKVLAKQLKGKSKILCLERPVTPLVGLLKNRKKLFDWLSGKKRLKQIDENLFVYTPFLFLHDVLAEWVPLFSGLNRKLTRFLIKKIFIKLKFRQKSIISCIYHPYQLNYIGLINETISIYECYDDYTAFKTPRMAKDIKNKEDKILKKADIVLTVSQNLLKEKTKYNECTYLVPNAVDFGHFSLAGETKIPIAEELVNFSHPIIGFAGNINERIDFRLIDYLAISHPEYQIVFVGGFNGGQELMNSLEYRRVLKIKNIYFLGPKRYEELPNYLKAFDVCIIPYSINQFNISCSPLKLYEYMATGKPIISTDIPAVRGFEKIVYIAKNNTEFERYIIEASKEKGNNLCQERLSVARENSWEQRVKEILLIIDNKLKEI